MLITFDLETFTFSKGLAAPRPVVMGVKVDDGPVELVPLWSDRRLEVFEHPDALYLGHNIPYDFSVLAAWGFIPVRRVFELYRQNRIRDTLTREQLLDIYRGRRKGMVRDGRGWRKASYSLASLETRYTGKDRSQDKGEDAWRKRYGELFRVPLDAWPEDAVRYVKEDVDATFNVYRAQLTQGGVAQDPEDETRCIDEHRQVYKAWCLRLISCWGVRTNPERTAALEAEVSEKVNALQEKMLAEGLYKWGGTKKAPKLTKDMKAIRERTERAYEQLGEEAPTTDKGNIKTDADALTHSGDELLVELGGGGPLNTVLNTFLPVLKSGTEVPINTSYDALKNTGRTSSYAPNLANIPRSLGVRECFEARPGRVFCSVDWAAAELRALAQVCLWMGFDSVMAKTFQKDPKADPHTKLAARLLKVTDQEFEALKAQKDPRVKKARQDAKAANFGYPGGMRERKFVAQARKQGMQFTHEEATALRNAWLQVDPAMGQYLQWGANLANKARDAGSYNRLVQWAPWRKDGKVHRVRGGLEYSDLLNTTFQGLVADAFCDALSEVSYRCYCVQGSKLYGARVVFALYDELIIEVEEARAHDAAWELNQCMLDALNYWCPDVPAHCEPALMKQWWKAAELKTNSDGRLIPWEPA